MKIHKEKLYQIVFESDTRGGKLFDVLLLWSILISIMVAVLDSIPQLHQSLNNAFYLVEWFFTILFTIEYFLRIYIIRRPKEYIFSFWGLIDLMAILPTYLSLIFMGSQYMLVVRVLRLLRVFRVLRLLRFYRESLMLLKAFRASFFKISIFLSAIVVIVILLGTIMYVVEGGKNGFSSIPQSIYWAVITITTVGYGDIVPQTVLGKIISSVTMILGYSIIAVPTGFITVEMTKASRKKKVCPQCGASNDDDANYCSHCGEKLE